MAPQLSNQLGCVALPEVDARVAVQTSTVSVSAVDQSIPTTVLCVKRCERASSPLSLLPTAPVRTIADRDHCQAIFFFLVFALPLPLFLRQETNEAATGRTTC